MDDSDVTTAPASELPPPPAQPDSTFGLTVVNPGRLAEFPEPLDPQAHAVLVDAVALGRRRAAEATDWLTADPVGHARPVPAVWLESILADTHGMALPPGAFEGRVKAGDGSDEQVVGDALTDPVRDAIFQRGGGLHAADFGRFAPAVARLCSAVAVARGSRVEATLVLGADPTHLDRGRVTHTWVLPLQGDVIVQGDMSEPGAVTDTGESAQSAASAIPFDLARHHVVGVVGAPRIFAPADSVTLLVHERQPGERDRLELLMERAKRHPLLRMDIPADVHAPLDLGDAGPAGSYLDVFRSEVASLRANAPDERLGWWWLLRSGPVRPAGDEAAAAWSGEPVRGRFPAGVGFIPADQLVVSAGGCSLLVPESAVPLVVDLLAGGEVIVPADSPDAAAVRALIVAGLVEPIAASEAA